uniref:Uncharacterized protein n=1 Tax=Haptolina brevifila TaxID=156173 RepID=A0A7S2BVA4_9EUKA
MAPVTVHHTPESEDKESSSFAHAGLTSVPWATVALLALGLGVVTSLCFTAMCWMLCRHYYEASVSTRRRKRRSKRVPSTDLDDEDADNNEKGEKRTPRKTRHQGKKKGRADKGAGASSERAPITSSRT